MKTFHRFALAGAVLLMTAPTGLCQDRGFSVVNFAGRFLGYGWTKGGYHAPVNAQIAIVKHRHPAHAYGSSGLLYPYSPGYQPMRSAPVNYGLPPAHAQQWNQRGYMQPTPAPQQPATRPSQAQPPAGPPPEWFEKFKVPGKNSQEEIAPPPPLDSREALPRPSAARQAGDPFGYDQTPESSPSDRGGDSLLDEPNLDDNLLDSGDDDDDLLLLDEDDFTQRQRPSSRARTTTVRREPIRVGNTTRAIPASHRNRYRPN